MARQLQTNEENIKNTIVLPVLQQLGFKDKEISFEDKFELRLGHSKFEKDVKSLGYSDILIKSPDGSKNYFIVEVKKDGLTLTDDDKEQAISYARLVHPIAPFTILTNGQVTKIYDTISKSEIEKEVLVTVKDRIFSIDPESEIDYRYEAMCNLIGYNIDNIALFSESQQNQRMSTLVGDKDKKYRKYIHELFCAPLGLEDSFKDFLNSRETVFLIVGDQGVGKTNSVCNLARESRTHHISFFFAGQSITKNIYELIKDDCNSFFSPQLSEIEVIKRLNGFTNDERKLIIFLDAVDEATLPNFPKLLDEFVLQISNFGNLKIVLSSKTQTYNRLLTFNGVPSKISEKLFKQSKSSLNGTSESNYSYRINLFDEAGFKTCYEKYSKFYNFSGQIPQAITEELHRGIALKVFALVFENKEIDATVSFHQLFSRYIEVVLEKCGEDQTRRINEKLLEKLGELILHENEKLNHIGFALEHIDEENFKSSIGLKVVDTLPNELFDYNILEVHPEDSHGSRIGFYYSFIRDFIILDRVLKVFTLNESDFRVQIEKFANYSLGEELISVTYLMSDWKFKSFLSRMFFEKFERFAKQYIGFFTGNQLMQETSQRFRLRNNLGFVSGSLDNPFSLIMLERGSQEPLCHVVNDGNELKDILDTRRIYRIQQGGLFLLMVDPDKHAQEYFLNDCIDIVRNGNLNEEKCKNVEDEIIFSIIDCNRDILGLLARKSELQLPDSDGLFPLTVRDLKKRIDLYYRGEFLHDLPFEDQLFYISDILKDEHHVSFPTILNYSDLKSIASKLKRPSSSYLGIHDSFQRNFSLELLLRLLGKYPDANQITPVYPSFILPDESQTINADSKPNVYNVKKSILRNVYSEDSLKEYFSILFKNFLIDYQQIIERNFEGMKGKFELFNRLPSKILFSLDFGTDRVIYSVLPAGNLDAEFVELQDHRLLNDRKLHTYRITELLMPKRAYPIFGRSPERVAYRCPLRNFLYNWIESELSSILKRINHP